MSRVLIVVFTVVGLALPVFVTAQSGGVQDGVKVGKAYVSGENPIIRLLDKAGGTTLTRVSFWRVIWSPAGAWHVCYVTTGDEKSPSDLRIAIVDNQKLYEHLTNQILGTYNRTYQDRPYTVIPGGTFQYMVELIWRDFYEPFQLDTPSGGALNPFGITSLFVQAKTAGVIIKGNKASGNVYPQMQGPMQSSTAFLAFSESWTK